MQRARLTSPREFTIVRNQEQVGSALADHCMGVLAAVMEWSASADPTELFDRGRAYGRL